MHLRPTRDTATTHVYGFGHKCMLEEEAESYRHEQASSPVCHTTDVVVGGGGRKKVPVV